MYTRSLKRVLAFVSISILATAIVISTPTKSRGDCSYIDQVASIPMPVNPLQMLLYNDTLAIVLQHWDTLALTIVNIANPLSPQIVATIDSVSRYNFVSSIALDSNFLYVGTFQVDTGLFNPAGGIVARFDLTDPLNPVQMPGVDIFGGVWKLSAHNNQVLVAYRDIFGKSGFSRLDFSNSSTPFVVGYDSLQNNPPRFVEKYVFDVATDTSGRYTYVAAGDSGLLVYDNTLRPESGLVLALKFTLISGDKSVTAVSVQDDRLLVTGEHTSNQPIGHFLRYFDISNPVAPVEIGDKSVWYGVRGKLDGQYMLWKDLSAIYIDDSANLSGGTWFGLDSTFPGNYQDFQRSGDYIFTTVVNRVGYGINDSLKVYRFTGVPRPPYFVAPDTVFVNEAQRLDFDILAYDDDECFVTIDTSDINPANMFFYGIGGQGGPTIGDSIRVTFLPDWNQAGTYNVTFRASDRDDTTFFTVTVIVNDRTPLYNSSIDYYYGDFPDGVASADFDKDGDIDLVETGNLYVSSSLIYHFLRVLDNDGTGLFTQIYIDTLVNAPAAPATADLNGDTLPDIVLPYYDFRNIPGYDSVAVMINNGNGTFAPQVMYQTGPAARYVHLFDADGDTDIDIAAIAFDDSTIAVILNNGDGTFGAPTSFPVLGQPQVISSADIDGDFDLDLLIPTRRLYPLKPELQIYLNDGTGSFTFDTTYISPRSIFDVKAGDIDGDGDQDMIVARDDTLTVMMNDGTGRFPTRFEYESTRFMYYLQLKDVDNDGSLDVLAASDQFSKLQVFQNNGDGSLQQPVGYPVGASIEGLDAADVDGDGDIDAILVTQITRGVEILLNNTLVSNHAPTFSSVLPDQFTVIEGDTLRVTVSATDPDGQTASLSASGLPTGATLTDFNNGSAELLFVPSTSQAGSYPVSLFASDGSIVSQQDIQVVVFNADGLFGRPVTYSLTGTPTDMALADLNNDGSTDIAVATVLPHAVEVWSNNGTATFTSLGSNTLSGPPSAIAAGDFDGDFDIDLALSVDSSNTVEVLMNSGSGSFASPVVYPNGGIAIVAADFDLDNDIDLAIARSNSTAGVYLLNNDSAGIFAPGIWNSAGTKPVDMIGYDYDGNGSTDLAVADASTGHVWILLSNGSGFDAAVPYVAGRQLANITSTDLDGDSDFDIVATSSVSDTVAVLLNNGDGTFVPSWQGDFGYHPGDIYAGRLKPSGTVKLVGIGTLFGGEYAVTAVSHRMSDSSYQTSFSTDLYFNAGRPISITGARLDIDNDEDLVILDAGSNRFTILPGISDTPTGVDDEETSSLPTEYVLNQNYPNPFNPSTTISFSLPRASAVRLDVFNILGQRVIRLIDKPMPAGHYLIEWDSRGSSGDMVASGVYFYRLSTEQFSSVRKMLLLK